jgi:hypothetical protein
MESLLGKAGMLPQDYIEEMNRTDDDDGYENPETDPPDSENSHAIKSTQHNLDKIMADGRPDCHSSSSAASPESVTKPLRRPQTSDSTSSRGGGGSSVRSVTTPITPRSETLLTDGEYVDAMSPSSLFMANIDRESRYYGIFFSPIPTQTLASVAHRSNTHLVIRWRFNVPHHVAGRFAVDSR